MTTDSDADLWQLVLAGDERAYGVIWDRHRDRILGHLVSAGNSVPDAEDLTAAVFLELWRRRDAVRMVNGSVLPWLIVTAQNLIRNARRARARYRRFLASLPPPEHVPDHAEQFASRDDHRTAQLRAAIARSRSTDAALLALTALEGFTVTEAAAAVGLSEPAARMRLSRFRAQLRASIEPALSEGGSA